MLKYLLKVWRMILMMFSINANSSKLDIVNVIKKYVPDFMHIETGKHLDQKM